MFGEGGITSVNADIQIRNINAGNYSGPGTEELDGLAVLERKRRRDENLSHKVFYKEDGSKLNVYNNEGLYNSEATLSAMDCDASSYHDLVKLAKQASHSP